MSDRTCRCRAHGTAASRRYVHRATQAPGSSSHCVSRNLCSDSMESMLERLAVRHEPPHILYFSQDLICEPPKIIQRPSFDSHLRGRGVGTRSCRYDLDLQAAPHHACTASALVGRNVADCRGFAHSPLLCAHVSISTSNVYRPLRSLAATSVADVLFAIAFTGAARACTTTLSADNRQLALRSPGCVRRVIPGTAADWPYMMCMIPAWYTCCSKPRPTTSTQASFARLHERRRALPP